MEQGASLDIKVLSEISVTLTIIDWNKQTRKAFSVLKANQSLYILLVWKNIPSNSYSRESSLSGFIKNNRLIFIFIFYYHFFNLFNVYVSSERETSGQHSWNFVSIYWEEGFPPVQIYTHKGFSQVYTIYSTGFRFRYTLTKVSLRYTLYTLQGSGSDIHSQRFLSGIHFILYRVQVQIYAFKDFSKLYTWHWIFVLFLYSCFVVDKT